jgi:hypothetical protein
VYIACAFRGALRFLINKFHYLYKKKKKPMIMCTTVVSLQLVRPFPNWNGKKVQVVRPWS